MCLLDVPRECTHTDYTSYSMSALSRYSRTSYAHYFRVIINIISILSFISNDFNFPKIPKKLKIIKSRMPVRTLFFEEPGRGRRLEIPAHPFQRPPSKLHIGPDTYDGHVSRAVVHMNMFVHSCFIMIFCFIQNQRKYSVYFHFKIAADHVTITMW